MKYKDSIGKLSTSNKIMKVNHAGEFGAINIYRAQIFVSKIFNQHLLSTLEEFIDHEKKHLNIFWSVIQSRGNGRCKSFWLCGIGGFALGFITALLGKPGIMSCTLAVETVVTEHLKKQLRYLNSAGDSEAYQAVFSILAEEEAHRDKGYEHSGQSFWFKPLRFIIRLTTESIIRFGMR